MIATLVFLLGILNVQVAALRYDPNYVGYNLNTNETADNVLDYWGAWENVSTGLPSSKLSHEAQTGC
jgi:hypothetical protein